MGLFDLFSNSSDPATYEAPKGIPSPDQPRELALYKYDYCGFCQRVLRALRDMPHVQVELRDTLKDRQHQRDLVQATGMTQVPCLFVDGVPFHESADIVEWLQAYAIRGGAEAQD